MNTSSFLLFILPRLSLIYLEQPMTHLFMLNLSGTLYRLQKAYWTIVFFFHIIEDMFAHTLPGCGYAHLLVESLNGWIMSTSI